MSSTLCSPFIHAEQRPESRSTLHIFFALCHRWASPRCRGLGWRSLESVEGGKAGLFSRVNDAHGSSLKQRKHTGSSRGSSWPIALPSGHFMGLAPIDTWVRLLIAAKGRIGPRYWLRLGCAMGTSLLATAITLPERLVLGPWLWWRFRRASQGARSLSDQDIVVVTGYFRSGTTHLHNLLAVHPDVVVPKWVQAMSPQGFWLSWAFLRWALVPFLPNTRPQDDVAFGPDWPAEDDFAHNNWALASSLPARLVLPGRLDRFFGFHDLEGLRERQLHRWERVCRAFVWKVLAGKRHKTLVLKTPSHTARVGHLDALFDSRVRFVHIARQSGAVVRSNVAMHARLEGQSLCELPDEAATRQRVIEEYVATEKRFAADVAAMGLVEQGRAIRLRYEDLVADPIGQCQQVCRAMGLRWDDEVRVRLERYLQAVGTYTPRTSAFDQAPGQADPRLVELDALLAQTDTKRGDDQSVSLHGADDDALAQRSSRLPVAVVAMWGVALGCLGVWLGLAHVSHSRLDFLAWPLGGVIGAAGLRLAGRGSRAVGLWAVLATLGMVLGSIWPMPEVAQGWVGADRLANLRTAWGGFNNNYIWVLFGLLSAWRYGTRTFARPPGMDPQR